jgi:NAD(P)H-nitrite reductase large subunit
MKVYDYIIVGGGIAGTVAAETVRQREPASSVAIIGAEPHRLYSRVLLPHVLRGKSTEAQVFLRAQESYADKRIDYLSGAAVVRVDSAARRLTLADGTEIGYAKALLIATGGAARRLSCPGAAEAEVLHFQTLDDTRRIAATSARRVAVIGGGFIALELHMSLAHMGISTTGILRGEGFFSRTVDERGRAMIADEFSKRGIPLHLNVGVSAIESHDGIKRVLLSDGTTVDCDAVAAGVGLEPGVSFLEGSGIAVLNGVLTDNRLRTNVPGVYAAGDVAESPDPLTGEPRLAGNWQNAMFQGKVAGANMSGDDQSYETLTSYSISCFGMPIAAIGAADFAGGERVVRHYMDASLQFVIHDDRIVGASCVGPFAERAAVTKLMSGRTKLTDSMRQALADHRTAIASLIS